MVHLLQKLSQVEAFLLLAEVRRKAGRGCVIFHAELFRNFVHLVQTALLIGRLTAARGTASSTSFEAPAFASFTSRLALALAFLRVSSVERAFMNLMFCQHLSVRLQEMWCCCCTSVTGLSGDDFFRFGLRSRSIGDDFRFPEGMVVHCLSESKVGLDILVCCDIT